MGESGLDDTVPASSPPDVGEPEPTDAAPAERYRLGAELGRGGMGRVVEAFDTRLGRAVAVKEVLSGPPGIARRFRREVQITARLEHASIVPLYDAGTTSDGRPFYVMRRVSGQPLDQLIARAKGLDERLALLPNLLAAIDAVAHAHRRGVIHRDLKPANILVGDLGETVVIDWGLAKVIGEPEPSDEPAIPAAADSLQTQVGSVFGTPGFMPPEQARGDELGPAGDVFALGATLYHVLVGKPPIPGKSATDVLASTLEHKIVPVEQACPTAPAELVAIVDKALAFEARQRYADAGALGEDVRRFLTGQLVAAHRYTRRQRLARFVRRHRGVLAVTALSLVAVAVLAWISVSRVLHERDVARSARAEAELRRRDAEQKAGELVRRADQLRVLHARTLLDSNPTGAVAVLKGITPGSASLGEARAIAKAAITRGVAWGLPGLDGMILSLELTRDGRLVAESNRAGEVRVLDVDAHRVVATRTFAADSRVVWVDGDRRLLVTSPRDPPVLFEPRGGTVTPVSAPAIDTTSTSDDGALVAFISDHRLGVLDVKTGAATLLPVEHVTDELAIAPDGAWIAASQKLDGRQRLAIVDRTGKELAHHDGAVAVLARSAAGKLAVSTGDTVIEVTPGGGETKVPLTLGPHEFVHWIGYRGDALDIFLASTVAVWNGTRVYTTPSLADSIYYGFETAHGALVATANDGKLHVVLHGTNAAIPLPSVPEGPVRLAAHAGLSRFVTTGQGVVLVWNVDDVLPRFIDTVAQAFFIDDERVIETSGLPSEWSVLDLATGARHPLGLPVDGMPLRTAVEPRDGRVLIAVQRPPEPTSAVIVYPDLARKLVVPGVAGALAVLVGGDAVAFSPGRGRVMGKIGDGEPHELVRVDGDVLSIAANGDLRFAALGSHGELVRGRFDGSQLARVHADLVDDGAMILSDSLSRVLVATGNRLLRWDGDVREIAKLAAPIDSMVALDAGVVVTLANREVDFIANNDPTPRRLPLAAIQAPVASESEIVGMSPTSQVVVIDAPSLVAWTLPRLVAALPTLQVSPGGKHVLQSVAGTLAVWTLPAAGDDLGAWLDDLTNAEEKDGVISWP